MMNKGRIRKFFAGANSAYGFYSLYGQLYSSASEKVFILKGGPGTGKSTFLNGIGEGMRRDGFDVEYHYCSANPQSLDGVVIPAAGVALLDGTNPHVVDPRYPGVVEEIINLGAYWDEASLLKHKTKICSLINEIGQSYQHAYVYLAAAKKYRDAVGCYYGSTNHNYIGKLNSLALELIEEILNGQNRTGGEEGQRSLFASAITSQGTINYLENLLGTYSMVFLLRGDDGVRKRNLIKRVSDAAVVRGFYVETFCCALDPLQTDHLLIPELEVALVNCMEPHSPKLSRFYRSVDMNRYALSLPHKAQREMEDFFLNYEQALQKAVSFLDKANRQHDELESLYIPSMDFSGIEALGKEMLEKIHHYAHRSMKATEMGE